MTRVLCLAMLTCLLLGAPVAHAAKPDSRTTSISPVVLNSQDGLPHFAGQMTFDVFTTATTEPWVNLRCYRNEMLVSDGWHGFFPAYGYGQTFLLGPTSYWTAGPADCTARVVGFASNGRETTLATTRFHVYA